MISPQGDCSASSQFTHGTEHKIVSFTCLTAVGAPLCLSQADVLEIPLTQDMADEVVSGLAKE